MDITMVVQRETSVAATTFGEWSINGQHECLTLEDEIREIAGRPVAEWKIKGETCIPSGRFELALENSPRFGPDTITIKNVPGFDAVRVHGGNDKDDTEGCILVGDRQDRQHMTISGAKFDHVLDRLKAKVKAYLDAGDSVYLEVRNPA